MRIHDRIIGVLAILGGIAVIGGTFGFRDIPGQQFGSSFFPRILGVALILTGIIQIIVARGGPVVVLSDVLRGRATLKALCVALSGLGWIFLTPHIGFIATTTIMIAALSVVAGGRPIIALAVGAGMSLTLYGVFALLLRVPLPRGYFEALLQ